MVKYMYNTKRANQVSWVGEQSQQRSGKRRQSMVDAYAADASTQHFHPIYLPITLHPQWYVLIQCRISECY